MTRPYIIGVMGGGTASRTDLLHAYRLGELIAENGWILLNGGRNSGIMEASAKGAFEKGGFIVGILPDDDARQVSRYISIPIVTGMGSARNCINVLSSDVVVACPGGPGTLSEIALALKCGKNIILLNYSEDNIFAPYLHAGRLSYAASPEEVIAQIDDWIQRKRQE